MYSAASCIPVHVMQCIIKQLLVQRVERTAAHLQYYKLAYFNKMVASGSTKQRSESDCVDYDRKDADSVLDCTMSLDVDGDSGDSDLCHMRF